MGMLSGPKKSRIRGMQTDDPQCTDEKHQTEIHTSIHTHTHTHTHRVIFSHFSSHM